MKTPKLLPFEINHLIAVVSIINDSMLRIIEMKQFHIYTFITENVHFLHYTEQIYI